MAYGLKASSCDPLIWHFGLENRFFFHIMIQLAFVQSNS